MDVEPVIKFSEHVLTTRKLINNRKLSGKSIVSDPGTRRIRQKVVRIIFTDLDATDSSSDEEDEKECILRVKRHVRRIEIVSPHMSPVMNSVRFQLPDSDEHHRERFKGVRQRKWGRWVAEVRDTTRGKCLWLGTYDTPEEAAAVYHNAAVRLRGPNAVTNFPSVSQNPTTVTGNCHVKSSIF